MTAGSLLHEVLVQEKEFQESAIVISREMEATGFMYQPRVLNLSPPPTGFVYDCGGYENELEFALAKVCIFYLGKVLVFEKENHSCKAQKIKLSLEAAAAGHPVALQEVLGSMRNVDEFVRLGLVGEGEKTKKIENEGGEVDAYIDVVLYIDFVLLFPKHQGAMVLCTRPMTSGMEL